jgi:hypothetical protein
VLDGSFFNVEIFYFQLLHSIISVGRAEVFLCFNRAKKHTEVISIVADCGEGVCVDPGEKGAILGTRGPVPPERGKGWQLAPDSRGEGT